MPSQSGYSTRPHAKVPPSFLDMDACTTSQLNVVLVHKLQNVLCAWLIFDTLSISVCATMHCQTSGQLVQELNGSTMYDCKCLSVYTYIVSVYKHVCLS